MHKTILKKNVTTKKPPKIKQGDKPEYMTHMAAGHDLQRASTHPSLEAELEVLSSPDIKARVVGS